GGRTELSADAIGGRGDVPGDWLWHRSDYTGRRGGSEEDAGAGGAVESLPAGGESVVCLGADSDKGHSSIGVRPALAGLSGSVWARVEPARARAIQPGRRQRRLVG